MKNNETSQPNTCQIIPMPMEEVMHNSMIPYAEHVIMERAVPRVEDGLKPVQRRILYTMLELGTTPETPHRKCARIVGDCLGKFHPHGDSSVYEAMVRLAQSFSMSAPLVDGHGNFGSVDGDSAAAMRYTEARMTPLAVEMLKDIDKDTVPFRLNFDDTLKEPDMLPASFPNLLVNGSSGIAVGLATNIPPHNLRECIQAVIAQIENPDITTDELMEIMPAPDFPTGGLLINTPEIKTAYETGRGKLLLRARTHIEDSNAGRKSIVITELPYQVNKASMLEKILKLSEEKKVALSGIYDIRDESDRTGMRAVIELKKGVDADKILAFLFKYSDMQVTFGVNMVAIADGKPKLLSLRRVIRHYIHHRKNVITRRTEYELSKAKARAHILEGLMIAVDNLDEVIALIRQSENPKGARLSLIARFDLTEIQAQAILDMRLQRLTGLEILSLRNEYNALLKQIEVLEGILSDEKKLLRVVKKELSKVAETYGKDRRTELISNDKLPNASDIAEIIAEDATVTLSENGILRRMNPRIYKRLPAISIENDNLDDRPLYEFETLTDHNLYFFTNLGNCYILPISSLPEIKQKDKGQLLRAVLPGFDESESIVSLICARTSEIGNMPDLLFVTKLGMLKRSTMKEYDVRRQKFIALNLKENDTLITVFQLDKEKDVLLLSKSSMSIRFHADTLPTMGRVAGGVKGIKLDADDFLVFAGQPEATDQILLVSERGFAKRILYMDFEPQARSGKGVKSFYFNKSSSNGTYIAIAMIVPSQSEKQCLLIHQKFSPPTLLYVDEIFLQSKQDRGTPHIMAIMDDIVLKATPYTPPAAEGATS